MTKKARDLVVTGVIENLDLRGWSFEKCKFTDVAFTDCEVDETTSFESCDFAGKLEITGSGWGKWALVKRAGCNLSAIAQMVFADTLKQETLPDSQAVQEVVALALGRFWRGGRLITSIRGENWRRGPLGKHRLCDRVLEVLIRHGVVEEIRIPSVQEGGIALIREAIPDIQRFMDNRQVSGRLISVVRSLTRE